MAHPMTLIKEYCYRFQPLYLEPTSYPIKEWFGEKEKLR